MQALEPGNKIERAPRAIVVGAGPAGLMAAEVLARGGPPGHRIRPRAVSRAQIPAGGPRRAQSHPYRSARPLSRRAMARRPCGFARRSRHFSQRPCATGARRSASRPSSGRAGASSPRASRPRLCCAPGCGGSPRSASNCAHAIDSSASTEDGKLAFEGPDGRFVTAPRRGRPRAAAAHPGRGLDRMGLG